MGSKNPGSRFWIGLSVGLGIGMVLGAVLWVAVIRAANNIASNNPVRRYSDLAVALEDGSLTQGSELPLFPKPGNPTRYEDDGGSTWWMITYPVETDTIILYGRALDPSAPVHIYGAQRVPHSRSAGDEQWYFCDPALMAEYVTIATREPGSP